MPSPTTAGSVGKKPATVIVLGATSKPNAIDPSLRRYGRFEKEIRLPVPDRRDRLEILRLATMRVPLADAQEEVLEAMSAQTHGYVGADLMQLVSEAGYHAIQQRTTAVNGLLSGDESSVVLNARGEEVLSPEYLATVNMTRDNFQEALKRTNPSSLRENVVEIPNVSWEDIGGLEHVKQELFETIQYPIRYSALYERFALSPSKGVLFYGPPGCGKTMLAKAVASECGANFLSVKGPELLTMWFGESEANVRELFDKARAAAPCILFFDELDSIAKVRSSAGVGGSEAADRVINQILTEIDGVSSGGAGAGKQVFVIGATNRPDVLDPAMTRPGRLDQLIYIPLPDTGARRNIFRAQLKNTPLAPDVDLTLLVNRTEGFSGADITEICQRAVKLAIRELVTQESTTAVVETAQLFQRHLVDALNTARKSVSAEDLLRYEVFGRERNAINNDLTTTTAPPGRGATRSPAPADEFETFIA